MKSVIINCIMFLSVFSMAKNIQIKTIERVTKDYREAAYTPLMQNSFTSEKDLKKIVKVIPPVPEGINRQEILVKNNKDNLEISLYIYRPKNSQNKSLPIVYYTHGGGYLMRLALYDYNSYQNMADILDAAVITPKYRLSTEAAFPAALEDVYLGLEFLSKNAANYNLDSSRIILMGDSAGGGLATSLALYNRDNANIKLLGQVLIYPMLDSRTGSKKSLYASRITGEICWNGSTNNFAWEKLKGNKKISEEMLSYFSPAQAKNLTNLPPTFIYVGELDLFVNENLTYASKLIEAGVSTELCLVKGLYHAFNIANPEGIQTREFWNKIYERTNDMLNN